MDRISYLTKAIIEKKKEINYMLTRPISLLTAEIIEDYEIELDNLINERRSIIEMLTDL